MYKQRLNQTVSVWCCLQIIYICLPNSLAQILDRPITSPSSIHNSQWTTSHCLF
jgi:hypothetical protein